MDPGRRRGSVAPSGVAGFRPRPPLSEDMGRRSTGAVRRVWAAGADWTRHLRFHPGRAVWLVPS